MEQPCRKALDLPSAAMLMQIPPITGLICRRRQMPPARSQSSNNARPACWPRSPAIGFSSQQASCRSPTCDHATRSGAVSIACNFGIGVLALTLASPNSPAQAQSADLVLCDRVAADPSDPDKPTDVKGAREIAQLRYRNRDQILPGGVGGVAPGALPARSRLRRQSTDAGSRRVPIARRPTRAARRPWSNSG